jgi:ethanolamine utilization protein EutM
MDRDALGLVETAGLVGAIEACDAAAKAAAVRVYTAEVTEGTLVTIKFEGELGAVQAAADAASAAARKVGQLIAVHVIPRPDDGLDAILPPGPFINRYRGDSGGPAGTSSQASSRPEEAERAIAESQGSVSVDQLKSMTVSGLRRFARSVPNLGIQGRAISRASKSELIERITKSLGIE